jgi:hypothetical protein
MDDTFLHRQKAQKLCSLLNVTVQSEQTSDSSAAICLLQYALNSAQQLSQYQLQPD